MLKSKVRARIQKRSLSYLSSLQRKQDSVNFHSGLSVSSSRNEFLSWVRRILPEDKYEVFKTLMTDPAETVRVTNEVYKLLRKVFDGKDKLIESNFSDIDYSDEFKDYLAKSDLELFLYDNMKYHCEGYVVVDMPLVQDGDIPAPYSYVLNPSQIFDVTDTSIIFIKDNVMYAYDDVSYSTYEYEDGDVGKQLSSFEHGLGYCPKVKIWKGRTPLEDYIGDLRWLLFFGVSKKYADLYSAYAVYWGLAQECNYESGDNYCHNGFLKVSNDDGPDTHLTSAAGGLHECPVCSERLTGVGSFVEVDYPEEGTANIMPPVGKINVDDAALKYNVAEMERLTDSLITGVTGGSSEPIRHTAVNKDQIVSLFESKKTILNDLKGNFERVHHFIVSTYAKLQYEEYYFNTTVKYGMDFYLYTDTDLATLYQSAIAEGADTIILDYLQDEYINTKYRYDEKGHQKATIIKNIDPYRHTPNSQMLDMFKEGIVDREEYLMKVNLSSLIVRFERENVPLIDFGKKLMFDERIETIRNTIFGYINDKTIINN